MKFKPDQCESNTRSSNYSKRCLAKGYYCKTSKKFRCKNHAGMSTGPRTLEGKLKSLQNLKQFKNVKGITTNSKFIREYLSKVNDRKAFNSDLQRQGLSKLKHDL